MIIKSLFRYAIIGVAFFSFIACEKKPEKIPLRIALNPWPGYEFLYLAQKQGIFAKYGYEVQFVEVRTSNDCKLSLENNQVDMMAGTIFEVQNLDTSIIGGAKIILPIDYSNGGDLILADTSLKSLKNIKGKNIAVEAPAGVSHYLLYRAAQVHGFDLAQNKIKWIDVLSQMDSLKSGGVDVVVTYVPTSLKILADKKYHVLFASSKIPMEIVDVLAVRRKYLKTNPNFQEQMFKIYAEAISYYKSHQADAAKVMAERDRISPQEFIESLQGDIYLISPSDYQTILTNPSQLGATLDKVKHFYEDVDSTKRVLDAQSLLN